MNRGLLVCTFAILLGASACSRERPLARGLAGGWVLDKQRGNAVGSSNQPRLMFIGGSRWAITQSDPLTRKVVHHHGGTFKLKGDEYVERVEYANPSTMNLVGKQLTFKVRLEGGLLTKTGVDNQWTETWKRLDGKQ